MLKLPNGIGDYKTLVNKKAFYADRTSYIELLENAYPERILFLRPRRFGKSLFLSTLNYYYGLEYKEEFQSLFGDTYIGKNPTPLANEYLILRFNFSRIDTSTPESTYHNFLDVVKNCLIRFVAHYSDIFKDYDTKNIEDALYPQSAIDKLWSMIAFYKTDRKVYVLIDEYDHFANELVAYRLDEFRRIVGRNGWVRKFYEEIKKGSDAGIIERIFITGISPLTMDSMTSGFNIATNITTRLQFNEMCGFTETEVLDLLNKIGVPVKKQPDVLYDLKAWYNGYMFNQKAVHKMYNPSMVLYFMEQYQNEGVYPDTLLDTNLASDYSKISSVFKIGGQEENNFRVLEELLREGDVLVRLTRMYSFERPFTTDDMLSLLYYNGVLTISGAYNIRLKLSMPNFVITQLYYEYFYDLILRFSGMMSKRNEVYTCIDELSGQNHIAPLLSFVEQVLTELSNRDKMQFNEKQIKVLLTGFFYQAGYYLIYNEFEVIKEQGQKGYIDLLLIALPQFHINYQFVFEIKYLKKTDAAQLPQVQAEAIEQLTKYAGDERLHPFGKLTKYAIVFVGNKGYATEVE